MTDQTSQFFAILTAVGEAKQANANALGVPWSFAQMGVGDANLTDPIPSRDQKKLINERRRAPLNQVKVDPDNASIIIAEQVIPPDVGGWWIREIGLYDADGDLVAVANCAPSFKPLLSQGTGKTQVVRLNIIVTSTANVQLKIDPAVVLATREYVDSAILNVLPLDKVAGTYSKVRINARGVVQQGFNPTTLAGYGITDSFSSSIFCADYNDITNTGLYHLGRGATSNSPPNFSGSAAFHHKYDEYSFTLAYNLGTDLLAFRRKDPEGFGTWRNLWHSGNFDPASKADKATDLAGYGINVANQAEAEAGADTAKPMTALRVFQAIAKVVRQATETVPGWLKIGTQGQVDTGTGDDVAVTPKKMRLGFHFYPSGVGYVVFPTWLGGLILQWQSGPIGNGVDTIHNFVIPYPNGPLAVFATCGYTPGSGVLNYHAAAIINKSQFMIRSSAGSFAGSWIFSVGC
ncbi:phage tail protein [Pseudomonas sp. B21-035]|uniref:phage tail protein n=1 Tax=Pseudomonas sp. B21-035 TaxID=2895484 RepID=UPI00215EDA80|nr:phage tail protein [Pseudomonas sp. B21-035]UVL57543.1 phage tail protein [Pseudomonas sp. B21-035]